MNKLKVIIYWVRRDFRLTDNPALTKAIDKARQEKTYFLPIFVLDEGLIGKNHGNIGYPRRLYLSRVLSEFVSNFKDFGIFHGSISEVFQDLKKAYDIEVFANQDIEEYALKRDIAVAESIGKENFHLFKDQLTVPFDLLTGAGNLYSVFSPFRKAVWNSFMDARPCDKVNLEELNFLNIAELNNNKQIDLNTSQVEGNQSKIFSLLDTPWVCTVSKDYSIDLDNIFARENYKDWYVRDDEALLSFKDFVDRKIQSYKTGRDSLEQDVKDNGQTSKMSVALKWGLISPRIMKQMILDSGLNPNSESVFGYISELIWREFYKYIYYHNPNVLHTEFQKKYQENPIQWVDDITARSRFEKWIKGQTGYEVVDAAMHQIAKTGWMHNRARMIVASVLTKNLGVDWRWGQEYFRSVLLDLDEASNNGGWQWAASVGADPKPIRIFNPYLQQENYDKKKVYINHWLPKDYNIQEPIIDHKLAREEALKRYNQSGVNPRDY